MMVRDGTPPRIRRFPWIFIGEIMITFGLVLILFLAYDIWWTTSAVRVRQEQAIKELRQSWGKSDAPEPSKSMESTPQATPRPKQSENHTSSGQEYARGLLLSDPIGIIRIPRLGKKWQATIHEGVHKRDVLDRGFVGHYSPTALPGMQGNVALAAHSITHGALFAHLNRLRHGDRIYIETQYRKLEYVVDGGPYITSPQDVSVITPVPRHSGFDRPGKYITLTTCWPPMTSSKRMIYWGHQVSVRTE
ncbi:class E sortase [Streptomyces sp. NPDC057686]|uniref:class E sortase n=1 Tax=Streptomyces sp. NPDC057686 TaxID=3346212 RepID=UPI0036CFC200